MWIICLLFLIFTSLFFIWLYAPVMSLTLSFSSPPGMCKCAKVQSEKICKSAKWTNLQMCKVSTVVIAVDSRTTWQLQSAQITAPEPPRAFLQNALVVNHQECYKKSTFSSCFYVLTEHLSRWDLNQWAWAWALGNLIVLTPNKIYMNKNYYFDLLTQKASRIQSFAMFLFVFSNNYTA